MSSITRSCLALAALIGALSPATAEMREFTDDLGRKMKFELVSHTDPDGATAKFRMESGKEMDIPVEKFSRADEEFIRAWMKKTPAKIDYNIRLKAAREAINQTRYDSGSYEIVQRETAYRIELSNGARQPISNLKVKYQIFYTNSTGRENEQPSRRAGSSYLSSGTGGHVFKGEAEIQKKLDYNAKVEFLTTALFMNEEDWQYGSYDNKDELHGIIIRVYDAQGEMVAETKYPDGPMKKRNWAEPKKRGGKGKVIIQ